MEIALIIILFIYLIITIGGINSKIKENQNLLLNLNKKVNDLLSKNPLPIANEKIETKQEEIVKPIDPILKVEVEEPIIAEEKPSFVITESTYVVTENEPKVVFEMDKKPTPVENSKPIIPQKSWWENFKEKNPDLEKFIGENLINKIGVLILVLGISYFVKYSIDKGWISEEARVGIGILSGALVLGIAHKLRQKYAAFSSVFVAGAIAIFYFTIAIAFHDYKLFGQQTAFVIMVIITIFSCLISLAYNRKELAVLSLIGGFSVPFMVSTGAGNYQVLFSYILILNAGILAIAYFKKWSIINILSFIFTVLLYGVWLGKDINIEKPHYIGAFVFGLLFYLLFIATNIINNIRTKGVFSNSELAILSINTFLFYSAGMFILNNFHQEYRGLFTTCLGILNLMYAYILYKKFGLDKKAVYLLIGLTLTFVTLAIPIQFKGNQITLFWAAEAVLLLWLGIKSKVTLYKFGSVLVTILMLFSLLFDWVNMYSFDENLTVIFNKICITGLFSIASIFFQIYLLKNENENSTQFGFTLNPTNYSKLLKIDALFLIYIVGFLEVYFQANNNLISSYSSASIVVVYHLIFSAVFFYLLNQKNKENYVKFATIFAIFNIILAIFWFSNYPFFENNEILSGKINTPVAFYLHYIILAITIYFGVTIYKNNSKNEIFNFFNHKSISWIVAFLIIYLASSELMLHAVVFGIDKISDAQAQANKLMLDYNNDIEIVKWIMIEDAVYAIRNLIIRTGFPILWGIIAFVFLIFGIRIKHKMLRIIALTLLGITILKLFLYDIKNVSETGKIIAFILLGVLILIISFVYQKLKILVIEDKPLDKKENE